MAEKKQTCLQSLHLLVARQLPWKHVALLMEWSLCLSVPAETTSTNNTDDVCDGRISTNILWNLTNQQTADISVWPSPTRRIFLIILCKISHVTGLKYPCQRVQLMRFQVKSEIKLPGKNWAAAWTDVITCRCASSPAAGSQPSSGTSHLLCPRRRHAAAVISFFSVRPFIVQQQQQLRPFQLHKAKFSYTTRPRSQVPSDHVL